MGKQLYWEEKLSILLLFPFIAEHAHAQYICIVPILLFGAQTEAWRGANDCIVSFLIKTTLIDQFNLQQG